MNFTDLVNKFLDNANVGKVVADGGSGLALSIPLLMILGLSSNMSVVPADTIKTQLVPKQASVFAEHLRNREAFCSELGIPKRPPAPRSEDPDPTQEQVLAAQRCYLDGVREAARLNGEIEILRSQYAADLKAGKAADTTLAEQQKLQPQADRLSVQQEITEDSSARLAAAENELKDARSFAFNARTLTENLSAILGLAFVLAVIGSQVARLLFVNLAYDRLLKPEKTDTKDATSAEADSLRANYLRYTEAAINMILPVLLFAFVYPKYSADRLGGSPISGVWYAGGIAIAAALFFVGMFTYRSYLEKSGQIEEPAPARKI
jgi:hypothetical protein